MAKICVGKHIGDITLNPLEYLLDDDGELMTFESEDAAKEFLRKNGFSDEDFRYMEFEAVEENN